MELSEFVKRSITQIIDGVVDSQKYAQEKGATVNPVGLVYREGLRGGHQSLEVDTQHSMFNLIPQSVEFDIVVSATEGGEIKAGIGVFSGVIGLGTQAKNEDVNTMASRIRFSVPVLLPQQEITK